MKHLFRAFFWILLLFSGVVRAQDTVAVRGIEQAVVQANQGNYVSVLLYADESTAFPEDFKRIPTDKLIGLVVDNCSYTSFPAFLSNYTNIQYLRYSWFYFDASPLREIPSFIMDLNNLESLLIEGIQLSQVPDRLGSLQKLTSLKLYYTQLPSFPDAVLQLKGLRDLDLSCNKFTTIPEGIGTLSTLESLNFDGGACGASPVANIPASIGNLTQLKTLTLGYTETPIGAVPDEFYALTSLKYFECNGCGIDGFDERIANLTNLEALTLINLNTWKPFPDAFFTLPSMQSINLYVMCDENCDGLHAQQERIDAWGATLEDAMIDIR